VKIMINANQAACRSCFFGSFAVISQQSGKAVCNRCGSENLIDVHGNPFQPIYGPDRRCPTRQWHVDVERRCQVSFLKAEPLRG